MSVVQLRIYPKKAVVNVPQQYLQGIKVEYDLDIHRINSL